MSLEQLEQFCGHSWGFEEEEKDVKLSFSISGSSGSVVQNPILFQIASAKRQWHYPDIREAEQSWHFMQWLALSALHDAHPWTLQSPHKPSSLIFWDSRGHKHRPSLRVNDEEHERHLYGSVDRHDKHPSIKHCEQL